jgi:RPA family protein
MKFRNFLTSILACAALVIGCVQEQEIPTLDEIKVSASIVGLPEAGGSATIEVNATADWQIVGLPENSWLSISPMSGAAGTTTVTFAAEGTLNDRTQDLKIECDDKVQHLEVKQLLPSTGEAALATCADVIAGPDGKVFVVKGVCTSIANTVYGNWYLEDETGSVYIYGTLDANGGTKNFLSLGISVGDVVTVKGPKTTYGTTIELVDVEVLDIEKSLISVKSEAVELEKEGGDFTVELDCKGDGVSVVIPEEAKSWLSVNSIVTNGDAATVSFTAQPNNGGDRTLTLTFETTSKGETYSSTLAVAQKGAVIDATAAEINAAADGATQYRITGYISKDTGNDYGNIYIKDYTGEVYVYGVLDQDGKSKNWKKMGIKEGDIVTVVGPKASYNNAPQMKNVSVEKHVAVADKTVAEFNAAAESADVYYRLSGTVSGLKDGDIYGNFDITDETGSVYVYGLLQGWGGPKKMFQELGVKNGDKVTIVGVRTSYKGTIQVGNAFFVAKDSGAGDGGNDDGGNDDENVDVPFTSNVALAGVSSAYTDGVATVNGTADIATLKFGTSKMHGEGTITLPAGTKTVRYYGVGWKGNSTTLEFSVNGSVVATQAVAANEGASGNAPYTMTVTASDCYSFSFDSALAAETVVTVKTTGDYRAIIFGVNAYTK